MTHLIRARCLATALCAVAGLGTAHAANVYIALGDSITFGETDLHWQQSYGARGYVAGYADVLGQRNGGVRPMVVNLAIDGETAASFMSGNGRTPPVQGRVDIPLQLQNLNYDPGNLRPHGAVFATTVAAQQAQGNQVSAVTITLGFNEFAALSALPPAQALAAIPATMTAYRDSYAAVLAQVRSLLPNASLSLLGYYNPFAADPSSPAKPIFDTAGMQLNSTIRGLALQYGASFVDTVTPFVGHEAAYTHLDDQPTGSSVPNPFGGVLPIGNVHPNQAGYDVIAAQVAVAALVPEPATWLLLAGGLGSLGLVRRRRDTKAQRQACAGTGLTTP